MKTVCEANRCTGCMACFTICPKQAIEIKDDLETYNAVIDESKCIDCGQCYAFCSVNETPKLKQPISWNQGWASSDRIRSHSSSGGVATAIEEAFVADGGLVCSCTFKDGRFVFSIAHSKDQIRDFCGSKYVKSSPAGVYKLIKNELQAGQKVLFVGLPCQVAAIKKFIGTQLINLYTIDLICHGTPSPLILEKFLKQQDISLSNISDVSFRSDNKFQLMCNEKYIGTPGVLDLYSIAFLNSLCYTENCYSCKYAKLQRVADITLGDSWGSKLPEMERKKGVSLILCQTSKGDELLKKADLHLFSVDLENAIMHNHQLEYPSTMPETRAKFFEGIKENRKFNVLIRETLPKQYLKQLIKQFLVRMQLMR